MNMTIYEYKSRCEWLAAFYKEAAAAETKREMQVFNDGPRVWEDCDRGPNMQSHPDKWRIKPESQDKGFDANSEANAHLIAAAPGLLESARLQERHEWAKRNLESIGADVLHSSRLALVMEVERTGHEASMARKAAIAKAEGRDA